MLSKSDLLVHIAAAGVNQDSKKEIFNTNIFKSIKLLRNCIKNNCKNKKQIIKDTLIEIIQ